MRFKIDWASRISKKEVNLPLLLRFTLCLRTTFQVQASGGLYLEGRFNGGFFAFSVWATYIWRGLYMEGIIFGIYGIILVPIFERHGLTYLKNEGRAFRNIGTTFKF